MKRLLQLLSVYFSVSLILLVILIPKVAGVESSLVISETNKEDFLRGTIDPTLDLNQSAGDIELKYVNKSLTDNSKLNFEKGMFVNDLGSTKLSIDETKVTINQGYTYNTSVDPKLPSNNVNFSFLDPVTKLLYVCTSGGLAVIDTKGTVSSLDDTLVTTYTSSSTPIAIGADDVRHVFLDTTSHLLYISTYGGGLSVIDTKGTKDVSDDSFVTNYTTDSTATIVTNNVNISYVDSSTGLLYIGTSSDADNDGALDVIDTKGTIDPEDDTNNTIYGVGTTPGIGFSGVTEFFLNQSTHLLYISGGEAGGLTVINTHANTNPADDNMVTRYIDSGYYGANIVLPSLAVGSSALDSTNNLLYISTGVPAWEGGLIAVDTKGTLDPSDDVIKKSYTETSSPAILSNTVYQSIFDLPNNLLYVITNKGVSVINTNGTVNPNDDTLVRTYTETSSPNIISNSTIGASLDTNNHQLYIATNRGLSVINLDVKYSPQGEYVSKEFLQEDNLWLTKTSMPTPRDGHMVGVIGSKIYVAGGTSNTESATNTLQIYDTSNDTWTSGANMLHKRYLGFSDVVNGKLYVGGGTDENGDDLDSFEVYDSNTNSWSELATLTVPKASITSGVIDGKIYIAGGNSDGSLLADTEVYDPTLDTWTPLTAMNTARSEAFLGVIDGKLYVAGGYNSTPKPINSTEMYDPLLNTWTAKASTPLTMAYSSSVVVDGKLYLLGGIDSNSSVTKAVDTIYQYNPSTNKWKLVYNLPVSILDISSTVFSGNNIYVLGGEDQDWNPTSNVYSLETKYLSDSYLNETYDTLTWASTTPSGTSVELRYSLDEGVTYTSLGATPGTHSIPDNLSNSLIYKAVLTTDNVDITPSLDSVTVSSVVRSITGTYISSVLSDGQTGATWNTFSADDTKPSGTSIIYETRSGNTSTPDSSWSDWAVPDPNIKSPMSKYIQYMAELTTTDPNETPVVHGVSISYTEKATTKVKITNIGSITGVADQDSLSYRVTSLSYLIIGDAEAKSVVHFVKSASDSIATTNTSGKFMLIISVDEGDNLFTYYSIDTLGNKSVERTLNLRYSSATNTSTSVSSESSLTESSLSSESSTTSSSGQNTDLYTLTIRVLDENNLPVEGATVVIHTNTKGDQTVLSDKNGYATFAAIEKGIYTVNISYLKNILGENVKFTRTETVNLTNDNKAVNIDMVLQQVPEVTNNNQLVTYLPWIIGVLIVILLVGIGIFAITRKKQVSTF